MTRQAFYQHSWHQERRSLQASLLIDQVCEIRKKHPCLGTRKLHELLKPFLAHHHLKIGRDALFDLLNQKGLLIRKRKRRQLTTNSFHWLKKYPNLIRDFIPSAPNQLWVSDITYWKFNNKDLYLNLITDAFSRYIVGYHGAKTLDAIETCKALKMALNTIQNQSTIIHHSDRGVQYCSSRYVKLLKENHFAISMTEKGDPLENAIAERINGIIKNEYLLELPIKTYKNAQDLLQKTIQIYNNERPHLSIGNLTPAEVFFSKTSTKPKKLWKNYFDKKRRFENKFQD